MLPLRSLARSSFCVLIMVATGCQTPAPPPPINVSEPGWSVRHGQAVWRPSAEADELAGELMLAHHPDGRSYIQFSKIPLPILAARITPQDWWIQFAAENKTLAHRGSPPAKLTWLHLPEFLANTPCPDRASFEFEGGASQTWTLLNRETQERITGYLDP